MNKYRAKKIEYDGITFDSKKEMQRYAVLKDQEKSGMITDLSLQVPFVLIPYQRVGDVTERAVKYIADFVYKKDGHTVVEDVKGYRKGQAYRIFVLKRKMMLEKYGIHVSEV